MHLLKVLGKGSVFCCDVGGISLVGSGLLMWGIVGLVSGAGSLFGVVNLVICFHIMVENCRDELNCHFFKKFF